MKRICVLGGGTGTYTVLTGLKKYPYEISAIVAMSDDGGSTGRLRTTLGVLPPGDIRQALVALSGEEKLMLDLLKYRFEEGELQGHNFGNLLLTALTKVTGDFRMAVKAASRLFRVSGQAIPVTLTKTDLYATLTDGTIIKGETTIDDNPPAGLEDAIVRSVVLKPTPKANLDAVRAILRADAIIIGPGDFWGSLLANLIVPGIRTALKRTQARKIFILNLMTRWGQRGFTASTYLDHVLEHTPLDVVLVNRHPLPENLVHLYAKDGEYPILDDLRTQDYQVKRLDLLAKTTYSQHASDSIRRSLLRHSPDKLARAIHHILS